MNLMPLNDIVNILKQTTHSMITTLQLGTLTASQTQREHDGLQKPKSVPGSIRETNGQRNMIKMLRLSLHGLRVSTIYLHSYLGIY